MTIIFRLTHPPASSLKIIDFGLATVVRSKGNASKVGTDNYSSFEKLTGVSYDGRDDAWGLSEIFTVHTLEDWGGSLSIIAACEVQERRRLIFEEAARFWEGSCSPCCWNPMPPRDRHPLRCWLSFLIQSLSHKSLPNLLGLCCLSS